MTKSRRAIKIDEPKRFWAKILTTTEGCWTWTGSRLGLGVYGGFSDRNRRTVYAHRFSYQLNVGPIPKGKLVLHRCDNPICVRPDHLFIGSDRDNTQDMIRKGRGARADQLLSRRKLSDDQIRAIRKIGNSQSQASTGRQFGVTQTTISELLTGKTWSHIH